MTVRTSVLWKMNIHMAKKWPGMVVHRSFIKEDSFLYRLYEQINFTLHKVYNCLYIFITSIKKDCFETPKLLKCPLWWIFSHSNFTTGSSFYEHWILLCVHRITKLYISIKVNYSMKRSSRLSFFHVLETACLYNNIYWIEIDTIEHNKY